MNQKEKEKLLLIVLIIIIIAIDYPFLDKVLRNVLIDYEVGIVERVIDGDTVVVSNNSIRLLGINSPEKGEAYYSGAKRFLEILVMNNTVKLKKEKEDTDKYNRKLRYLFIGTTNINLELVKKGFANFYFPSGKDQYYNDFKKAWEDCIKENINLCEKSKDKCSNCVLLKKIDYKNQHVIFYNQCSFDCELGGWEIKDEGRKKFVFPEFVLEKNKEVKVKVGEGENNNSVLFWEGEDYVWTSTGDTLFLRDEEGKLILWESY